ILYKLLKEVSTSSERRARRLVSIFEALRDALRADEPAALATVVEGPRPGAKLLVRLDGPPLGTLGNADLDRVVVRDLLGALASGLSTTRHYGPHGEAR